MLHRNITGQIGGFRGIFKLPRGVAACMRRVPRTSGCSPLPGGRSGGDDGVQGPSPAHRSAGPAVALDESLTLRRAAASTSAVDGGYDISLFSRFFPSIPRYRLYKPRRRTPRIRDGRPGAWPVRRTVASRSAQPPRGSLLSS